MQLLTAQTNCKFGFLLWQAQSITCQLRSIHMCMTLSRMQTPQITRTSGAIGHLDTCTRVFAQMLVRACAYVQHQMHLLSTYIYKYCTKDYTQTHLTSA